MNKNSLGNEVFSIVLLVAGASSLTYGLSKSVVATLVIAGIGLVALGLWVRRKTSATGEKVDEYGGSSHQDED